MSFVSVFYLVFLALGVTGFYLLPQKWRILWLLLLSWLFYLSWQPAFLLVLCVETLAAFWFGRTIAGSSSEKKKWLKLSVGLLLLPLLFFKYYNFVNSGFARLLANFQMESPFSNQPYLIPLGISFFTFQAISYVADIYRGYLKPEPRLEAFALYMAFFPTILAGPIERAKTLLKQLHTPVSLSYENLRAGMQLILWGAFKKVVLADRMKVFMDQVYADPQSTPGILVYFALVFSVFHLFCDFSAYSDIAVGSARIFGIQLTKNFDDRVYASPSRTIFWQGWHRSLTGWLRDYVFLPLSRHTRNQNRLYLNLFIVYLLVGIWHGATAGFVVWGALNGLWLILEAATKQRRTAVFTKLGVNMDGRAFNTFAWLFTFNIGIPFAAFFRTNTPTEAIVTLSSLANSNMNWLARRETTDCAVTICLLLFLDFVSRRIPSNSNFDAFAGNQVWWVRWGLYLLLSLLILRYMSGAEANGFMYYNF